MNEAGRAVLWDQLGKVCDCCGGPIIVRLEDRPFMFASVARAGYAHAVCSSCASFINRFLLVVKSRNTAPA